MASASCPVGELMLARDRRRDSGTDCLNSGVEGHCLGHGVDGQCLGLGFEALSLSHQCQCLLC